MGVGINRVPPPTAQLIDPKTGIVDQYWYDFFGVLAAPGEAIRFARRSDGYGILTFQSSFSGLADQTYAFAGALAAKDPNTYVNCPLGGAVIISANGVPIIGTNGNGFGYAPGAGNGGTVTQSPTKSDGVLLDKLSGRVTTSSAALNAGTSVTFTVANNKVVVGDTIIVNIGSGATAGAYGIWVDNVTNGSFRIHLRNVSASNLSETLVINFALIKAVST